jgi:hypothetical protein
MFVGTVVSEVDGSPSFKLKMVLAVSSTVALVGTVDFTNGRQVKPILQIGCG